MYSGMRLYSGRIRADSNAMPSKPTKTAAITIAGQNPTSGPKAYVR